MKVQVEFVVGICSSDRSSRVRSGRAKTAKQEFCAFRNCNIPLVVSEAVLRKINYRTEKKHIEVEWNERENCPVQMRRIHACDFNIYNASPLKCRNYRAFRGSLNRFVYVSRCIARYVVKLTRFRRFSIKQRNNVNPINVKKYLFSFTNIVFL